MNTISLTTHPPEFEEQHALELPDRDGLRRLRAADRITFRFGLWLLHRSLRDRSPARRPEFDRIPLTQSQAIARVSATRQPLL